MDEMKGLINKQQGIFHKDDFTKTLLEETIKELISNFEHEVKGRKFDQKM